MTTQSKTMKEVVAELRRSPEESFLELLELDVAVGEVAYSAQVIAAGVREIAEEAQQLVETTGPTPLGRLQSLAGLAHKVSNSAASHSRAITEIKRGIAAWSLV